ncbi:MAG: hypothetical protein D6744_13280 [Planctomycetota bacterium]|nr:MAG: hypothetical protein D6744_13280 [Planctomycetota bacterium]
MTVSTTDTGAAQGVFDPAAPRRTGALRRLARKAAERAPSLRELRSLTSLGRRVEAGAPGKARQAAALLVSQLFFAPLLAEARKLPFGRGVGDGGRGEEVFGERLDLAIADTVAASLRGGLTEQLENRLAQRHTRANDAEDGRPVSDATTTTPPDAPSVRRAEAYQRAAEAPSTIEVHA